MVCSHCQNEFSFNDRLKGANIPYETITCSNCKNTFIKDEIFRVLDIIISLILQITVIFGLIYLIDNISNNLYISTIVAILSGQFFNIFYLFLIQKFRVYKKA